MGYCLLCGDCFCCADGDDCRIAGDGRHLWRFETQLPRGEPLADNT